MASELSELVATDPSQEMLLPGASDLPSGDYGTAFVKMVLTLIVLVLLLWLTTWFLKRLFRGRLQRYSGDASILILERKALSPKTILYFVEVEGKRMILAESQLEVRNCLNLESTPHPKQPDD